LIYLGFITEGKLVDVLITPSLGVPNWPVIYIINIAPPTSFLAPLPGNEEEEFPTSTSRQQNAKQVFWRRCQGKRRLLQGEFRTHILYFVLSLLYFIFACIVFIKNTKKLVSL
jgi:hypothetical protein